MSADSERLPAPNNPAEFESLCLDLWRDIWQDPNAQKNGRNGQPQAGVDIFGQQHGKWIGVQCKQTDGLVRRSISVKELDAEATKALKFEPRLSVFILASSGSADATVQERARELTEAHQRDGFTVSVWSWREIWQALYSRPALLERVGPIYWPRLWAAFARQDIGFIYRHCEKAAAHTKRFQKRRAVGVILMLISVSVSFESISHGAWSFGLLIPTLALAIGALTLTISDSLFLHALRYRWVIVQEYQRYRRQNLHIELFAKVRPDPFVETSGPALRLSRLARRSRRPIVILGEPGSGKTESLRWLGAEFAKHSWKHLPLRVELRDIADESASFSNINCKGTPGSPEDRLELLLDANLRRHDDVLANNLSQPLNPPSEFVFNGPRPALNSFLVSALPRDWAEETKTVVFVKK